EAAVGRRGDPTDGGHLAGDEGACAVADGVAERDRVGDGEGEGARRRQRDLHLRAAAPAVTLGLKGVVARGQRAGEDSAGVGGGVRPGRRRGAGGWPRRTGRGAGAAPTPVRVPRKETVGSPRSWCTLAVTCPTSPATMKSTSREAVPCLGTVRLWPFWPRASN